MEMLLHVGLSNAVAALALALLALLAGRLCRRPAVVHGLWLLVLLKLLTPPLFWIEVPSWPAPPRASTDADPLAVVPLQMALAAPDAARPPEAAPAAGAARVPERAAWPWLTWLLGLWVAGSACWFGLALCRLARF